MRPHGHFRLPAMGSGYKHEKSYNDDPGHIHQSNYFTLRSSDDQVRTQTCSRHPLEHEVDVPLDAFDKQLLAELPTERQQAAQQGRARLSLPSRHVEAPDSHDHTNALGNDLYGVPAVLFPLTSSSPHGPVSSPTVAVQRKRRPHRTESRPRAIELPEWEADPPLNDSTRQEDVKAVEADRQPEPTPSDRPPVIRGIQLVPTSELPDKLRSVFPYPIFNAVQSKCFSAAYLGDDNMVVSAPTGSGKTVIMELAICRLVSECKNGEFKVVYQAPTKSLCSERYRDWETKFNILGLKCAELTGDTEYEHLRNVQQASVIITTPEKWDSVTRKWRDNIKLMQLIKLFLVDEVHILKDPRGATLEAVVSRMKSIGTPVRFVALSATVPNSEDIATWLGRNTSTPDVPSQREVFDDSFRPVKLEKRVLGYRGNSNDYSFDNTLMKHIPDIVDKYNKRKPTMVFCMTRKSSIATAKALAGLWNGLPMHQKPWSAPGSIVRVGNKELKDMVVTGVAFHHAGLTLEDRQAVEQGFINGDISVICSTSTLAVGVNLPCYLVVLQGTVAVTSNGIQEYSDLEVMQMLGRAGRPQFETSACAVVLTREDKVSKYDKMVSGAELLESTLHRNLIEHLNTEIGLGTVYDMHSAKRWLASTFLRVRLRRNPPHYQFGEDVDLHGEDEFLQQLCDKDINLLLGANLVEDRGRLSCTPFGEAMNRYYVKFQTMKTFASIPPKAKISEILNVLVQAVEFLDIRVKGGEKSYYKELNKANEIKFPIKVDIALPAHKASLILQAELGAATCPTGKNFDSHHHNHNNDKIGVFSHGRRLIRCIIDCQIELNDSVSTLNALELARSIVARAWDNSPNLLKQLPQIGDVTVRKLAARGINSIDTLLGAEPHRVELILGKHPGFGAQMQAKASTFPYLRVSIKEMHRDIKTGRGVHLKVKADIGFVNEKAPVMFEKTAVHVCYLAEDSNGEILDFRRYSAKSIRHGEEILLTTKLIKPVQYIRCHVMCDEFAGTCRSAELQLKGIPASAYPKEASKHPTPPEQTRKPAASGSVNDEFDDTNLHDDDFLAGDTDENGIEVVKDIDEILMEADNRTTRKRKRSRNSDTCMDQSENEHIEQTVYREPVQLANGRWTCQHLCKEKGIVCKHKCCREGVAKPRRASKKPRAGNTDDTQQKITSMTIGAGIASGRSHDNSQSTEDLHHANTTSKSDMRVRKSGPSSNRLSSPDLTDRDIRGGSPKGFEAAFRRKPQPEDSVPDAASDGAEVHDNVDEELLDVDHEPLDAEDCDWTTSTSTHVAETADQDEACNAFGNEKDWDFDLDKFLAGDEDSTWPPPDHVALPDVEKSRLSEKGLLLSGKSSSTVKKPASTVKEMVRKASLDATPAALASTHHHDSIDAEREKSSYRDAGPQASGSSTFTVDRVDEVVRSFEDSTSGGQLKRDATPKSTEEDKKQHEYEDDQKRKWAELDPWLYEEFGRFVELT